LAVLSFKKEKTGLIRKNIELIKDRLRVIRLDE
jgi:hypothetical protein